MPIDPGFARSLPDPPPALRALVEAELAQARRRALASLPNPVLEHHRTGSRWSSTQAVIVRRSPGRCVGCGCDLDDASPGCTNCGSRHAMRRRSRATNERSVADLVAVGDDLAR